MPTTRLRAGARSRRSRTTSSWSTSPPGPSRPRSGPARRTSRSAVSPARRTSGTGCATRRRRWRSRATGTCWQRPGRPLPDDTHARTCWRRTRRSGDAVEQLSPVPADLRDVPVGVTPVFSPRGRPAVLELATTCCSTPPTREGCITFAFGVGAGFKALLDGQHRRRTRSSSCCWRPATSPTRRTPTAFVRINAKQQRLPGVGVLPGEPGLPVGTETNAGAARAQPARQLHPLEVPAGRPARRRPDRRHRLGELQRGVDRRQRREHDRRPRRPPRRRHLLHRVQPPVQPLLLPQRHRGARRAAVASSTPACSWPRTTAGS